MIAAVAAALVLLILALPLGVWFRYDDGTLEAAASVGPVTVFRYPMEPRRQKPKKPPKPKKARRKDPDQPPEPKKKGKFPWKLLKPLLSILMDLLGKMRRKFLVSELYLCVRCGGKDAAHTALQYGKAWALIGSLDPVLHNCFRIANRQAEVLCDYHSDRLRLLLEMRVTLRVGTALWLGLQALCRLIPVFLQYKKKAVQ